MSKLVREYKILTTSHPEMSNGQFHCFHYGTPPKGTKTQTLKRLVKIIFFLENKVVINFDFRSGAKKSGHLDYPFQSYGPIMHKTCGEVLSKKTNTFIILQIEA